MYELANNSTGLLEGRKPYTTEGEARKVAEELANTTGACYQLWDSVRMIGIIVPYKNY